MPGRVAVCGHGDHELFVRPGAGVANQRPGIGRPTLDGTAQPRLGFDGLQHARPLRVGHDKPIGIGHDDERVAIVVAGIHDVLQQVLR